MRWIRYIQAPATGILLFFSFSLHAQTDSRQVDSLSEKRGMEKLLYLTGASLLFAGFDYVGYNLSKGDERTLVTYRIFQGLTQAAITYLLYRMCGLPTAISFNILWWTFGHDLLYYGFSEIFNAGGDWEKRGNFSRNVMGNKATWAWWTPIGILRGMQRDEPIAGSTLVAQSLIGFGLAVTITLTF